MNIDETFSELKKVHILTQRANEIPFNNALPSLVQTVIESHAYVYNY